MDFVFEKLRNVTVLGRYGKHFPLIWFEEDRSIDLSWRLSSRIEWSEMVSESENNLNKLWAFLILKVLTKESASSDGSWRDNEVRRGGRLALGPKGWASMLDEPWVRVGLLKLSSVRDFGRWLRNLELISTSWRINVVKPLGSAASGCGSTLVDNTVREGDNMLASDGLKRSEGASRIFKWGNSIPSPFWSWKTRFSTPRWIDVSLMQRAWLTWEASGRGGFQGPLCLASARMLPGGKKVELSEGFQGGRANSRKWGSKVRSKFWEGFWVQCPV